MILVDTGPLVALVDADDAAHQRCVAAAIALPQTSMVSTWPCFAEAMYLLGRTGGFSMQSYLWRLRFSGRFTLFSLSEQDEIRARDFMQTYSDLPMDLADATLMVAAESLSLNQIFTLDSDFRIYRLRDGSVLQTIP